MKKIVWLFVLFTCVASCSFAHSGRTDGNGGHYNRSTGEYHYHHGYSAHQHPNGVCPYERNNNSEAVETAGEALKTNDDSNSRYINELKEKISNLESQIHAKENTIENLNKRLVDKNKEIEEIKSSQESLNFILGAVIVGFVIYFFVKRRKSVKEH